MKTQTFKDGKVVKFRTHGMESDLVEATGLSEDEIRNLDKRPCIVLSLETYTELGDKDFEYYNVKFANGVSIEGLSGYHLDLN